MSPRCDRWIQHSIPCKWMSFMDPRSDSTYHARGSNKSCGSITHIHLKVMAFNAICIIHQELIRTVPNWALVVVDFTASWCGPCKFIAPVFAELSEKYPNLVFLKVDVDEMNAISTAYEVRAMPTFLFIEKGVVIDKIIGANKGELEAKVRQYSEICAAVAA
ncbi:hypothetical protein GOP47_0024000 [Adiantum capillus-veneris]|uniref:Thioredoxin domain-containing protein n=1 Tax=Adiantum capillus-veneris TaxID=13818 RepID=A0A9D4Z553_ADICA|nr:hypothetical protein GOP47_0023996 [Adiantum capillus-veneris]KAI5061495.1 hypothetical protein GOP47_0024000 [Adiantum capillus-veneris]